MDVFKELFQDIKNESGAREIQETITRSDLPYLLTGEALDRALLKAYREYPADYEGYVYLEKVRDFRQAERLAEFGGEGSLDAVQELEPYPYAGLSEDKHTFQVAKFGRKIGFSWEAFLNDDLGALKRIPEKLARAARRTELKLVTSLFETSSGPSSAIFTSGKAEKGTDALSITALDTALKSIGAHTTPDGEPVYTERLHLVVPVALESTARNILNAIEIQYTESSTTWKTANWMKTRIVLHVNPYISVIDPTNGYKTWFLFPDPADIETLVLGKLIGHEEPEIFIKNPNAMKIGGGEDPFGGDFDTDSIEYKVRHVVGGAVFDWRGCYASVGT